MSSEEFRLVVVNLLKIGAIMFAVSHFFIGYFLFRQIVSMGQIIKSTAGGTLAFISFLHVVLLAIIVALIFFIPA